MSQGKGKASSSSRRPLDDHPARPSLDPSFELLHSAPSSSFDLTIPFNLPPRRSMKMLKDGSDYVWPEAAHSLFVRGLQAWKFMNIGSKRTRAPRGEGKTDFLVRYLESHGVERSKKQVASHLQVLRTEWRNSENLVLLSLVDDNVPHTRSSSEPSLPAQSPSNQLPYIGPPPDHRDDRTISTPSLPSPISALPSPITSSSLYHPAHEIYSSTSPIIQEKASNSPLGVQSNINLNVNSWAPEDTVWTTSTTPEEESYPAIHYSNPNYARPSTYHDYDRTPRPASPSSLERRGVSSDFFAVPGPGNAPSSSVAASHHLDVLPLDACQSYDNALAFATHQATPHPQNAYGTASIAYRPEPYQTQYGGSASPLAGAAMGDSVSPFGDVVESAFLTGERVQQSPSSQPQWTRPPASVRGFRSLGELRKHERTPPS